MFTNQEIFDNVTSKLRAQNAKSEGEYTDRYGDITTGCLYRGPNGTKCAAGHCIPDEIYTPSMEGKTVRADDMIDMFKQQGYNESNLYLLNSLQRVHDSYKVESWENRFRDVAEEYGLVLN